MTRVPESVVPQLVPPSAAESESGVGESLAVVQAESPSGNMSSSLTGLPRFIASTRSIYDVRTGSPSNAGDAQESDLDLQSEYEELLYLLSDGASQSDELNIEDFRRLMGVLDKLPEEQSLELLSIVSGWNNQPPAVLAINIDTALRTHRSLSSKLRRALLEAVACWEFERVPYPAQAEAFDEMVDAIRHLPVGARSRPLKSLYRAVAGLDERIRGDCKRAMFDAIQYLDPVKQREVLEVLVLHGTEPQIHAVENRSRTNRPECSADQMRELDDIEHYLLVDSVVPAEPGRSQGAKVHSISLEVSSLMFADALKG